MPSEAAPLEADVVVIGAGPGGLAAAYEAQRAGRRVVMLDLAAGRGGQIWRESPPHRSPSRPARLWLDRLANAPVPVLLRTTAFDIPAPGCLHAEHNGVPRLLYYHQLVLAPGARERFLPFPGWTLPGVTGVGGLQALVQGGVPIAGRRVVIAGSGPLLPAVAAHLRHHGARIALIAEQASAAHLRSFAASLMAHAPAKLAQALGLGAALAGVRYRAGHWVEVAEGADRLESVVVTNGRTRFRVACDALASAYGLVPNIELPSLLGCQMAHGFVVVNDRQETSQPGVFAVGELTGIGGLDKALLEGQIAGMAAADAPEIPLPLRRRVARQRRFTHALDQAFALRSEILALPRPDTIVCRCEDVNFGQLARHSCGRDAKLQTRFSMGPCQGRVCGAAAQALFGWRDSSIRPPIWPVPANCMAGSDAIPPPDA